MSYESIKLIARRGYAEFINATWREAMALDSESFLVHDNQTLNISTDEAIKEFNRLSSRGEPTPRRANGYGLISLSKSMPDDERQQVALNIHWVLDNRFYFSLIDNIRNTGSLAGIDVTFPRLVNGVRYAKAGTGSFSRSLLKPRFETSVRPSTYDMPPIYGEIYPYMKKRGYAKLWESLAHYQFFGNRKAYKDLRDAFDESEVNLRNLKAFYRREAGDGMGDAPDPDIIAAYFKSKIPTKKSGSDANSVIEMRMAG